MGSMLECGGVFGGVGWGVWEDFGVVKSYVIILWGVWLLMLSPSGL